MKKVLALLVISIMMFSLAACGGSGDKDDRVIAGSVTLGNTTELTGDWITTFQNNAADRDILEFISGYSTVGLTFEGEYVINDTAVKDYSVDENADGSKTYTFEINKGLLYSNEAEVTAKDYVGGILLWNSKFIQDLGGNNTGAHRFVGHSAYANGSTNVFSGVRLLDDYKFSLTINADYVPYFYELALVGWSPYYLPFWLGDDIDVLDDGNGAYFSEDLTEATHKATFEKGRFNPQYVSSGAYFVESYDEAAKTAVLKINEHFAGDYTGQRPSIETVIYKKVINDTLLDEFATGTVDILVQLVSGTEIDGAFDLYEQGGYSYTSYPRAGYAAIFFVHDHGPTQFKEVRQAIGHLLDRNEFARTFTSGYGAVVNGPFGESQWFYQAAKNSLDSKINQYAYSAEKAVELLVEGGWVLDANGNDYVSGIRHKDVDGEIMPLRLLWSSSEQNSMSDLLVVMLANNEDVLAAGIEIIRDEMTFTELLNWYYRDGSQDAKYNVPHYNMFNLATNFTPMYDLTKRYSTDPADLAMGLNTNFIIDDHLEGLANKMVLLDPEDRDTFVEVWEEFIVYWNDILVDLPLYSNIYHDFYIDSLKNFNNNSLIRTAQALLYAYIETGE